MIRIFLLTGLVCLVLNIPASAQVSGCTDPAANNYNSLATVNNGSCLYNTINITPTSKATLSSDLHENSGLIFWNDRLWTHNDGGNSSELVELDTAGVIIRKIAVTNATNVDWEDITQDINYVYIGDFGNNASGNRQNLRIYKILKSAILAGNNVTAEIINFAYSDQTNFTAVASNTTNFDCESMIIFNSKIYLFSKRWTALGTSVYELTTSPGTQTATRINTSTAPSGLVTGADVMEDKRSVALCGYTSGGARFLYLLYDFTGNDFFSGNRRYVGLNNFGQTEGIAFRNPEYVYISRENLTRVVLGITITFPQALEAVNLTNLLSPYYLLPIQFINLSIQKQDMGARVRWEIMPKEDFAKGMLQRRTKKETEYQNIYPISTASGWYDDNDSRQLQGSVQYRLKVLDRDARETYSKEYKITFSTNSVLLKLSNGILTGELTTARGNATLELYDATGARIFSQHFTRTISTNISNQRSGIYIVIIRSDDGQIQELIRFMK
jgi:hypothetical protein